MFEARNLDEGELRAWGVVTVGDVLVTPPLLTEEEARRVAEEYRKMFENGLQDIFTEPELNNDQVILEDPAFWVTFKHLFKAIASASPLKPVVRRNVFAAVVNLREAYLRLKASQADTQEFMPTEGNDGR